VNTIELCELEHTYELTRPRATSVHVLNCISLSIAAGEFVAFVGPTGCGKTTLLRIICGLVAPSSGTVRRRGSGVTGMVFQTPALLPWLSVSANIELPLRVSRNGSDYERGRTLNLLRRSRLERFATAYPHELSIGMQQKVSLCRALITHPDLLLLDEPFSALDALTREHFNVELAQVWAKESPTAILVTHSISEAIFLADRVYVLTERPARIALTVRIDLARPRKPAVLQTSAFHDYEGDIRSTLGLS
jgi:NitT/TauT family transport system ATP-binding protein